jgi:hypothetical protein
MTTRENKKIPALLTMLIFLSAFSLTAYAQVEKGVIENLVLKLQQKVLLTEEQSKIVETNLVKYFKETSEANLESAKENIEALLDNKQKAKYNIIKKDWWESVIKESKDTKPKE